MEDWKGRKWSLKTHRESHSEKATAAPGVGVGLRGSRDRDPVVRTEELGGENAELGPQARRRGHWLTGADVSEGTKLWLLLRV